MYGVVMTGIAMLIMMVMQTVTTADDVRPFQLRAIGPTASGTVMIQLSLAKAFPKNVR